MGVASIVPLTSLMSRDGHVLVYAYGSIFAQNPWSIVHARHQRSPSQTAHSHAPGHNQSYKHKSSELIVPSELMLEYILDRRHEMSMMTFAEAKLPRDMSP